MEKNFLNPETKSKIIIIAEAGVNHNGKLSLAKELVDVAKSSGADYVKFQMFSTKRLVTPTARSTEYQKRISLHNTQYEILKNLELTKQDFYHISNYCKTKKIGFLSTGFDIQSVNELNEIGMDYFKVPSGEINNLPYLRFVGGFMKPVIISTGMATNNEIRDAIEILVKAGTSKDIITALHCTSEYPAPFEDINLSAMLSIKSRHKIKVGYSDHSTGIEVAIASAAIGAEIIEKHVTLDKKMEGPDHKASLEPHELKRMINSVRNIEKAIGDGEKKVMASELKNKVLVRKSIVAACDIIKGQLFTPKNLDVKRPGYGLSPMFWDKVIGRKAVRDFQKDEMIEL
ncbi:MAG: N-acetylneuraminate synthase [Crocinitomicaceae bacterium]|nr:N-acetylneuraminate synthase [Crocinitomicaceae bacterium]